MEENNNNRTIQAVELDFCSSFKSPIVAELRQLLEFLKRHVNAVTAVHSVTAGHTGHAARGRVSSSKAT